MRIAFGGRCELPYRAGESFSIPFSCGCAVPGGSLPDGALGNLDCFPESPADCSASFPDCPIQSAAFVPQREDSASMREISCGARGMRRMNRIPQEIPYGISGSVSEKCSRWFCLFVRMFFPHFPELGFDVSGKSADCRMRDVFSGRMCAAVCFL